jgi:aspartyl protease family protein
MVKGSSPWEHPPKAQIRRRYPLWFALVLAAGLGLWQLSKMFPGSITSDADRARFVYLLAVLTIVSSSVVFSQRYRFGQVMRAVALWTGFAAVLAVLYSYQGELAAVGTRLRSALIPSYGIATGSDSLVLSESEDGSYLVYGTVNGAHARFVVDTGSSDIVLSPADAQRAGIDVQRLDYSRPFESANGGGRGASVTVSSLTVGPIALHDVPVSVDRTAMSSSLLGMAFLKRLKSFEFRDRQLTLRWR